MTASSKIRLADEGLRRLHSEPVPAPEQLLEAFGDADCRCLLRAVSAEPRTAKRLADICDLPLSTTYRKLSTLKEAALIEEQTRISTDGRHASEFAPAFDRVAIDRTADGTLELHLDPLEPVD